MCLNFDLEINSLNSEIKQLESELGQAHRRKDNLQSAQALVIEAIGELKAKLVKLSKLLPPDCLAQSVEAIALEIKNSFPLQAPPSPLLPAEIDVNSDELEEPEQINNLSSQASNNFAPLDHFGEFLSYRTVLGQPGAIAYLASNNKSRLETWLQYLIVKHNFADCGEIVTPKNDKECRTLQGTHHLKLWRVSTEALTWICQNYSEKSVKPTYQDIPEWRRPNPADPKPYIPQWRVRINGEEVFRGVEEEAKKLCSEKMRSLNPLITWSIILQDDNYAKIDGWIEGDKTPNLAAATKTPEPERRRSLWAAAAESPHGDLDELYQTEDFTEDGFEEKSFGTNSSNTENSKLEYADLEALHSFGGLAAITTANHSQAEVVEESDPIPF